MFQDRFHSLRSALTLVLMLAAIACGGTSTTQLVGPDALKCSVSLDGPASLPARGARATLQVQASRDCTWTASSSAPWVKLSMTQGQGAATFQAVAADNTSSAPRTARIIVNDQSWPLTQIGAAPRTNPPDSSPGPAPPSSPPPPNQTPPPSTTPPSQDPQAGGGGGNGNTGNGNTGNGNTGNGNTGNGNTGNGNTGNGNSGNGNSGNGNSGNGNSGNGDDDDGDDDDDDDGGRGRGRGRG